MHRETVKLLNGYADEENAYASNTSCWKGEYLSTLSLARVFR